MNENTYVFPGKRNLLLKLLMSTLALVSVMGVIVIATGLLPLDFVSKSAIYEPESISSDRHVLEERWGIKIESLQLSAANHIVDFRYRVIDPIKAAPLFIRKTKPYIFDQSSNRKFPVSSPPKVGPMRSNANPQTNRVYFVIFKNPGTFIKSGNIVDVVIGDFNAKDLIVE
ncbi:hypothetical protein AU255_00245 [Methyloprofundus sedimenti]|uniref:Uncharacterized protein n=1 Tax=Methyloprofundus sedimenti TaxID=1420851 RepID=A0A1V8M4A2_9GAMM|nr:hypothetical protein [Methyloprofundus sedimenti]OQK16381.1 hypothetical protein AU255_00245 [Methyloprofundus sedimenti]